MTVIMVKMLESGVLRQVCKLKFKNIVQKQFTRSLIKFQRVISFGRNFHLTLNLLEFSKLFWRRGYQTNTLSRECKLSLNMLGVHFKGALVQNLDALIKGRRQLNVDWKSFVQAPS